MVGEATLDELAKKADALVVQAGGMSNLDASMSRVYSVAETAAALGLVEMYEVITVRRKSR
jgi:hypothetical protein